MKKKVPFHLLLFLGFCPSLIASPLQEGTLKEKLDHIDFLVQQKSPTNKKTISNLTKTLSHPNTPVLLKERIAWAFGELNLRSQVKALSDAAAHPSLLVRSAALDSLMRFRARTAFPHYVEISSNDPALILRQKATVAMGLLRWEKTIPHLVKLSDDPKEEIRGAAVLSMAATHSNKNSFKEILTDMSKDPSPYVQERVRKGMDIVNRKNKTVRTHFQSKDGDIRLFAALYLHYYGRKGDLASLKNSFKKEGNPHIKFEINQALKGIRKRVAREEARQH